jgi:thioredoxin 1
MPGVESQFRILNALVIAAIFTAVYFVFTGPKVSVQPPNDPWFTSTVVNRQEPVLVKFGADWCGPCRMMEPELDRLSGSMHGRVAVVRVNVDQHPQLAAHYGVSSIPRLMLFRHGQVVADRVGYADSQNLQNWIASNSTSTQ